MPESLPPTAAAPSRLLRGLLAWTAVTTLIFWLPAIRSLFDGPSYTWGLVGFRGAGLRGDYWLPLAGAAFALGLLALGWRGARSPFPFLLLGWHLLLLAGVLYAVRSDPEGFRFQGDSLGIDISLVWIGPLLFGIPTALVLVWAWHHLRKGHRPAPAPWNRRNSSWLLGLALLLPVQFALLHFGPPGSTADVLGVVITIVQWLLVGQALRPYPAQTVA